MPLLFACLVGIFEFTILSRFFVKSLCILDSICVILKRHGKLLDTREANTE